MCGNHFSDEAKPPFAIKVFGAGFSLYHVSPWSNLYKVIPKAQISLLALVGP